MQYEASQAIRETYKSIQYIGFKNGDFRRAGQEQIICLNGSVIEYHQRKKSDTLPTVARKNLPAPEYNDIS